MKGAGKLVLLLEYRRKNPGGSNTNGGGIDWGNISIALRTVSPVRVIIFVSMTRETGAMQLGSDQKKVV
jgi:hypothetical protein